MKSTYSKERGWRFGYSVPPDSVPPDGHLSREEVVELLRQDLKSGDYELGKVEYNDELRTLTFTTLKTPEGDSYIISFPYVPPEGCFIPPDVLAEAKNQRSEGER